MMEGFSPLPGIFAIAYVTEVTGEVPISARYAGTSLIIGGG